jgi:septal ring factor EnvC (AmiA/AmiB activator)
MNDVRTMQTYAMLTTFAGEIAGLRLGTEGLGGRKVSTQDAVRRGEITALQGEITTLQLDMTEVKKDVKEVKADVKEIELEMQGLRGDVKLEMQGLRAEMNTSLAGLQAASTNQFYTLAVVLAFIAAAIGKLSIGDATALIGK